MIRILIISVVSLGVLTGVYCGVFRLVTADAQSAINSEHPELEWLRREFSLTDAQFAEVRAKHQSHDEECQELCLELAEVQGRLDRAISQSPEMNDEVRAAMADWIALRSQCREGTLQHMYEISSILNPEAAQRYRERVFRTLIMPGRMPHIDENGVFHEQAFEPSLQTGEISTSDD